MVTERAESRLSQRLQTQGSVLAKAAVQSLSELNPFADLNAKVSDELVAEYTRLRLVPDTRQICDQRPGKADV